MRSYAARIAGILALLATLLLATPAGPAAAQPLTGPVVVDDHVHDGTFVEDPAGGTVYHYGTVYADSSGCQYRWGDPTSHFCGFAVTSAPSMSGPWSAPTLLFSPSDTDPFTGKTWDASCIGTNGGGCFNPRMVQRPDGVWILWFNAVPDLSIYGANSYNVMGCAGPAGPCGPNAHPNGSYNKPKIYYHASSNGDFSIITSGTTAWIEYTGSDRIEYTETLDQWWANGTGNITGHGSTLPLSNVEGAGAWQDPSTGLWITTLSYPECGYCGAVSTVYATAPSPTGPWTVAGNVEARSGPSTGNIYSRATVSAHSCGGQPRTVALIGGRPVQVIDLWTGTTNQANARTYVLPITYDPSLAHGTAGDGLPFHPPFADWTCGTS